MGYYPFSESATDIKAIPVASSINGTDYLFGSIRHSQRRHWSRLSHYDKYAKGSVITLEAVPTSDAISFVEWRDADGKKLDWTMRLILPSQNSSSSTDAAVLARLTS